MRMTCRSAQSRNGPATTSRPFSPRKGPGTESLIVVFRRLFCPLRTVPCAGPSGTAVNAADLAQSLGASSGLVDGLPRTSLGVLRGDNARSTGSPPRSPPTEHDLQTGSSPVVDLLP